MDYAVLFPGQGSQSVGMGRDIRAALPELCGEPADETLGWNLNSLIDVGPEDRLTETQHAQPALYAVSYALWVAFSQAASVQPKAAAGHSLGEYTALAASGSLDYLDGLRLVSQRGQAMAKASTIEPSGMSAILGADEAKAIEVTESRQAMGGRLFIANFNAPGQIVVAGGIADLDWLDENAQALGLRRVIRLKVQGAFHSPFMSSAADALESAIADVTFGDREFDVYANATAQPTSSPSNTLVQQLTSPVRFSESLVQMREAGIEIFVHIGPGDVTGGLAKRTLKGAIVKVVSSLDEAGDVARELSVE